MEAAITGTRRRCVNGLCAPRKDVSELDLKVLHAKIGQQALEIDFLRERKPDGIAERKRMIDRTHDLPMPRQYQILSPARSSAYYRPQEASVPGAHELDQHAASGASVPRERRVHGEGNSTGRKHVGHAVRAVGLTA